MISYLKSVEKVKKKIQFSKQARILISERVCAKWGKA
jgi:hypothetical protein